MKVADVLRIKGSVVKTVPPHETALLLSGQMRAEQIGALVVSRDGNSIEGIVSERDLAYGLATYGGRLPTIRISELMTKAVAVCSPEDSVTDVMKLMTMRRIRHVPVKDGDQLVGIISIGDVLKHRLGELEVEADALSASLIGRPGSSTSDCIISRLTQPLVWVLAWRRTKRRYRVQGRHSKGRHSDYP